MASFVIYMHTSPSGKSYIGQTSDYEKRSREHKLTTAKCTAFCKAVKKYGWDNFTHTILLEGLTVDEANVREQEMIALHKTLAPFGYNLVAGGDNGIRSEETRRRMSVAQSGRVTTVETKQRQRAAKIGTVLSAEHKGKIAKSVSGRTVSAETRAKIAASLKGKNHSADRCKNISDGKLAANRNKKEAA